MTKHLTVSASVLAGPLTGGAAMGAILLSIACGASRPAPQSRAGAQSTPACAVSPKDDACDICEAQKCCPEETACEAEAACEAADDILDACEARAGDAGHASLSDCYTTFGASGPIAMKRADCLRSNCKKECL